MKRTRANDPLATRGPKRRRAAVRPEGNPPPARFSSYDLLSPLERQRKQKRESMRRRRERITREFRIPRRKEMLARLRNGDREAAMWWGHYEMSCKGNRKLAALGHPQITKANTVLAAKRERLKREAEAAKWLNSM